MFRPGDAVMVRTVGPNVFSRTPRWAMGRIGLIKRTWGIWPNPDLVCRGVRDAPGRELHHVFFRVDRHGTVALTADIFEHWLSPAGVIPPSGQGLAQGLLVSGEQSSDLPHDEHLPHDRRSNHDVR